jgi:thiol-disulfide isomerase/thioredoxin
VKKISIITALFFTALVTFGQNSIPTIKVKSLMGDEVPFSDLFTNNDTITIVSFWATWCAPCIKEIDAFTEKLPEWQKSYPIKLIGVSVDDSRTANRVKSFVKGRGWTFEMYQDINNDLKRALNIPNVPHTMAVKNNTVLFHTDGYVPGNEDEIIEKIYGEAPKKDFGKLNGSIESTNQYYLKDSVTNAIVPLDKFGSNSYLKLDYSNKQFTAGVQLESYLPLLVGYPGNIGLNGTKVINKYFTYRTKNLEATVGDFYEQFGNGLLFRSFENRQIGINNAIQGVNVRFQPSSFWDIKVIYGKQRRYFDFSDGNLRGADFSMNWNKLGNGNSNNEFKTGIGFISRYDEYLGSNPNIKSTVNAWSARASYDAENFYINVENVTKANDAHLVNNYFTTKGKALQVNTGFSKNTLGLNVTLRRLENMDFRTDRDAIQGEYLVNFIPALTRQHDFALSNIYVYNAQALGEVGGQLDFQYEIAKGTSLGGKHGTNVSINYSRYNELDITSSNANGFKSNYFGAGKTQYFGDLNITLKKKLSSKTTGTFFYQNLYYNKSVVEGGLYDNVKANIIATDFSFKLPKKQSLHLVLQHLGTQQDYKSWFGGLAEYGLAPKWTWFVQSLYNYGNDKKAINYYTVGTSFTQGTTRLILNYGRQRQGLVCVGGVCRMVPAYTGLSATLTTSF